MTRSLPRWRPAHGEAVRAGAGVDGWPSGQGLYPHRQSLLRGRERPGRRPRGRLCGLLHGRAVWPAELAAEGVDLAAAVIYYGGHPGYRQSSR